MKSPAFVGAFIASCLKIPRFRPESLAASFFAWSKRYGIRERTIPGDHWLTSWEREANIRCFQPHPVEGYRRLACMMLDEKVVVASTATAYRILR